MTDRTSYEERARDRLRTRMVSQFLQILVADPALAGEIVDELILHSRAWRETLEKKAKAGS